MNDNRIVHVKTKSKCYDIIIGDYILPQIEIKRELLSKERFALIISSKVFNLYQDYIENSLKRYDNYDILLMEDGEENKSYKNSEKYLYQLLGKGYNRKSVIIGIGGGAVGDFSGFIAAVYMRGIPIIHVPTTLLAMVDASIGGKVAVNISSGKNIIGAFYQPELVISDVSFLKTLPENELKNGLVEILKHALLGESRLLSILLENDLDSIKRIDCIQELVFLSAAFKSEIVEKDEREGNLRAILNLGHTIGHAIESLMEYRGISHGEAVAIGLNIEMKISIDYGWLSNDEIEVVNNIMDRYRLLEKRYNLCADDIVRHMKYDKKNEEGKFNFVLLKGLGKPVYNQNIEEDIIRKVIEKF
ncbi:MAG: 3-dehydroquinate synthase [Spirochaetota bacterium]|nr:3-dehydroquinate synthase [Spirochaetota bacterium]